MKLPKNWWMWALGGIGLYLLLKEHSFNAYQGWYEPWQRFPGWGRHRYGYGYPYEYGYGYGYGGPIYPGSGIGTPIIHLFSVPPMWQGSDQYGCPSGTHGCPGYGCVDSSLACP